MIQIVDTTKTHLPQIAAIEKLCFPDPWSENMLMEELANKHTICITALCNSQVVGHATMRHIINEGHINNIAVHPDYRRQGIAKKLLIELAGNAVNRDIIAMTLEVRESNIPAISLYESHGFIREGLRKNYYQYPNENAIIMWKYMEVANAPIEME